MPSTEPSRTAPFLDLEPPTADEEEARTRRFSYVSDAGWRATGVVAAGRANPGIRVLELQATSPNADVTASLLRRVSVGALLADIQQELSREDARRLGVASMDEVPYYTSEDFDQSGDKPIELPLPDGYVRMSDTLLRRVAEEYLKEARPGSPPRPWERMAVTFGRPPETVRTWVSRARKAGWLAGGVRGRLGAGPGPRMLGYQAGEEEVLRGEAAKSPDGVFVRTSFRPDPDGPGGLIFRDTIPTAGPIERSEERVADWRAHVDALDTGEG
ncbi:hypothetical protein ACMZ5F_11345 [Streptomyces rhizosphaericola]|uniref:hypothetical protein n=1 Tax=Streptomyces rhizosphaericola TaxID=2564098 RepID=UPI0039F1400D